jgi:hypothetical protein
MNTEILNQVARPGSAWHTTSVGLTALSAIVIPEVPGIDDE